MSDTSTQSTTENAKDAADDVASDAKEHAANVAERATTEMRSVAADAKEHAADVFATTRDELRTQAGEHTRNLSASLSDLGRQLDDMATSSSEPESQMAQLAQSASQQLADRARRLDDDGFDGLIDDVKRFARNRPGAFLLGSIAAGFAIGRLAKHADTRQIADAATDNVDTDALRPSAADDDVEPADTSSIDRPAMVETPTTPLTTGATSSTGAFEQ